MNLPNLLPLLVFYSQIPKYEHLSCYFLDRLYVILSQLKTSPSVLKIMTLTIRNGGSSMYQTSLQYNTLSRWDGKSEYQRKELVIIAAVSNLTFLLEYPRKRHRRSSAQSFQLVYPEKIHNMTLQVKKRVKIGFWILIIILIQYYDLVSETLWDKELYWNYTLLFVFTMARTKPLCLHCLVHFPTDPSSLRST